MFGGVCWFRVLGVFSGVVGLVTCWFCVDMVVWLFGLRVVASLRCGFLDFKLLCGFRASGWVLVMVFGRFVFGIISG